MAEQSFRVTIKTPDGHPVEIKDDWFTDPIADVCHELGATSVEFADFTDPTQRKDPL
jgi:hypothetical protein